MGRGKRSQARLGSARSEANIKPAVESGVYPLPPWPKESWAKENFVTDTVLKDGEELARWLEVNGLEASLANAADKGLSAVASGESFDNAMGTHPYGGFSGGPEHQEISVYLTLNGEPKAELCLANLCAWASRPYLDSASGLSEGRLLDPHDLAAFARAKSLRPDWHEPDESEVTARVRGSRLDRGQEGFVVELCVQEWDDEKADYKPAQALAEVYLLDLLAWGGGHYPEPQKPGDRLRPSSLAE